MGNGMCNGQTVSGDYIVVDQAIDIKSQVAKSVCRAFPLEDEHYGKSADVLVCDVPKNKAGECLVFVEHASNVPYTDPIRELTCQAVSSKSHGEPFVKAWAEENGSVIGKVAEWSPKHASNSPCWYSARSLEFPISKLENSSNIRLRLDLWDQKTLIGSVDVPLKEQPLHKNISTALEMRVPMRGGRPCYMNFQVINSATLLHRRTVYFLRHGESSWNKAQSQLDLYEMGRQNDHPLSPAGRAQAEELCKRIKEAAEDPKASNVADLPKADIVYASPLTRAIQTAIIALGEFQAERNRCDLVLMPEAREKKNLGGFDSQPIKIGDDVIKRAIDELLTLYKGKEQSILELVKKFKFDTEEVKDQWWYDFAAESPKLVQARMEEFMNQLLYSPHHTIVVVGHSHFFRAIFKNYLSPELKTSSSQMAADLGTKKMSNCGVARVEMDPQSPGAPIVDVKLVLGTTLVSDHGKLSCSCSAPPDIKTHEVLEDSTSVRPAALEDRRAAT